MRRCYLIGSAAVKEELEDAGITCLGGGVGSNGVGEPQCVGESMVESKFVSINPDDDDIEAVVVAGDFAVNYAQICRASLYLQKRPHIPFLAGSWDTFDQYADRRCPGPTHIAAYGIGLGCGLQPVITGKPSQALAQSLILAHGLDPARTCMVGDRLDSDIIFGNGAGFTTLLVMSGTTDESLLQAKQEEVAARGEGHDVRKELWWPDCKLPSLAHLHPARSSL